MTGYHPIYRAYLKDVNPSFELPLKIPPNLVLQSAEEAPAIPGEADPVLRRDADCVLDVCDVEERRAMVMVINWISAVRIASACSVVVVGYCSASGSSQESTEVGSILWGHHSPDLSEDDVAFTAKHFDVFMGLLMAESYSRMANALRLHSAAVHTRNCDLALLGFVGAIESLFSIAPQELSFRLSLLVAKFFGGDSGQQRQLFDRVRALYKVRSKIAHGDKIASTEEAAAIEIADYWTPEAGEIARRSLKRIFEKKLTPIFNSRKQHEKLLIDLLFEQT